MAFSDRFRFANSLPKFYVNPVHRNPRVCSRMHAVHLCVRQHWYDLFSSVVYAVENPYLLVFLTSYISFSNANYSGGSTGLSTEMGILYEHRSSQMQGKKYESKWIQFKLLSWGHVNQGQEVRWKGLFFICFQIIRFIIHWISACISIVLFQHSLLACRNISCIEKLSLLHQLSLPSQREMKLWAFLQPGA